MRLVCMEWLVYLFLSLFVGVNAPLRDLSCYNNNSKLIIFSNVSSVIIAKHTLLGPPEIPYLLHGRDPTGDSSPIKHNLNKNLCVLAVDHLMNHRVLHAACFMINNPR